MPTPRAVCSQRQALLLPSLPGLQPRGQFRPALRAAGRLLGELHAVPPPVHWDSTWRDVALRDTQRRLRHLARARTAIDASFVRDRTSAMVRLTLPDVATHGDYQPHNWRWHRGRLSAIDFAAAGRRPAAWDLGRLRGGACWYDRAAWEALMTGYGRALSDDEEALIESMLPWRAVVAISFGLTHDRPNLVEHGRSVLDATTQGASGAARRSGTGRDRTFRTASRPCAAAAASGGDPTGPWGWCRREPGAATVGG